MGKGTSKAPPAPDMGTQINSDQANSSTATSEGAQTFNTAKAYNQNAQNTLSSVTSSEMPMMNTVNGSASQNLNTYGSTFTPLQQTEAQQAQAWGSNANASYQAGLASSNVNSADNAQRANAQRALESEGVDPASIHGAALDQQSRVQQAADAANAATTTYQNTKVQGMGLVNNANQLGVQVGQLGNSEAAEGSNIGNSAVSNTNSTNATGVNNLTAAATYDAASTNANNAATQSQQAQYQDQFNTEQADAANSGSAYKGMYAGMLGSSAISPMTAFMARGGVVPQRGAIPAPHAHVDHGGPVTSKGALPVSPIPGSTDTKPALLTPGEFVIPHDVASWKGHEYWYKQMDKARNEMSQRHGIPPRPSSALTARGV